MDDKGRDFKKQVEAWRKASEELSAILEDFPEDSVGGVVEKSERGYVEGGVDGDAPVDEYTTTASTGSGDDRWASMELFEIAQQTKPGRQLFAWCSMSPEILSILAEDVDLSVWVFMAWNPNCPATLLEKLAEDEDESARQGVRRNPNCPATLLEKLAEDVDEFALGGVVRNPNCPVTLLEKLAEDGSTYVREGVAGNPNCPATLLEKLAEDVDEDVRRRVAENPDCPMALLEKLAEDDDVYVRWHVAKNPNSALSSFVSVLGSLTDQDDEDEDY